ncbi:olfactory receptor class A-like protein 1 [Pleurodeles waltl]|uniref:olfactory receptor class A-like protein 1 n=1 Tax=Pleurodeles waltl TaxID=8319 RepID=UPI0037095367
MELRLILKAIGFSSLVSIGIPGNVLILATFIHIRILEKRLMPPNVILSGLAAANLLVIITKGIPQMVKSFGIQNIFNDYECKTISFMYRVSRGMTICITCLLSCNQCIIIAPPSKSWVSLKKKVPRNITVIIIALCCVNCFIYPSCILQVRAIANYTTSEYILYLEFCIHDFMTFTSYVANGTVIALRDFLFVGLMTLASCYIVLMLYRHRRQVHGIRSSDRNTGRTAEYTAARAVVLLVSIYVLLFGLDSGLWIYTLFVSRVAPAISDARVFFGTLYAALSPIVILKTNKKLLNTLQCTQRKGAIEPSTESTTTDVPISKN